MRKLIVLLPLLIGCAAEVKKNDGVAAQKTVCTTDNCIVAFGDSITAGYGTSNMAETSYAGRVAKSHNKELTDLGIGHSTLVDEMPGILNYPYKGTETIIMLSGYNDMRHFGTDATQLAEYHSNLKTIFDLWEGLGVEVYVGNCLRQITQGYPVSGGMGSDAAADLYAAELISAASGYTHIHVVDTNASWLPTLTNLDGDLVHPNDTGASQIAAMFLAVY